MITNVSGNTLTFSSDKELDLLSNGDLVYQAPRANTALLDCSYETDFRSAGQASFGVVTTYHANDVSAPVIEEKDGFKALAIKKAQKDGEGEGARVSYSDWSTVDWRNTDLEIRAWVWIPNDAPYASGANIFLILGQDTAGDPNAFVIFGLDVRDYTLVAAGGSGSTSLIVPSDQWVLLRYIHSPSNNTRTWYVNDNSETQSLSGINLSSHADLVVGLRINGGTFDHNRTGDFWIRDLLVDTSINPQGTVGSVDTSTNTITLSDTVGTWTANGVNYAVGPKFAVALPPSTDPPSADYTLIDQSLADTVNLTTYDADLSYTPQIGPITNVSLNTGGINSGGLNIKDYGSYARTVANAGATYQTDEYNFYGGSATFDGPSSNVAIEGGDISVQAVTIEAWLYANDGTYTQTLLAGENPGFEVTWDTAQPERKLGVGYSGSTDPVQVVEVITGEWFHLSVYVENGNQVYYKNGVQVGTSTVSIPNTNLQGGARLGRVHGSASSVGENYWHGFIQDFVIYPGRVRTGDFTPPGAILEMATDALVSGLPATPQIALPLSPSSSTVLSFGPSTNLSEFSESDYIVEVGNGDDGKGIVADVDTSNSKLILTSDEPNWDVGSYVQGPTRKADPNSTYFSRVKYRDDASTGSAVESEWSNWHEMGVKENKPDVWYPATAAASEAWISIAYGENTFVAVATGDPRVGKEPVMYSYDGLTWVTSTLSQRQKDVGWNGIAYGDGKFVAVHADGGAAMISDDGITWTDTTAAGGMMKVTHGNGRFVAVGRGSFYSTDGINWVYRNHLEGPKPWVGVTYGDGKFVAVSAEAGGRAAYSTDGGINWTITSDSEVNAGAWQAVTYGDGMFVAVGRTDPHRVMYSTDGINWTIVENAPGGCVWSSITYGNGTWVATGEFGAQDKLIMYTKTPTIGSSWVQVAAPVDTRWLASAYGDGKFVALGYGTDHVMYAFG